MSEIQGVKRAAPYNVTYYKDGKKHTIRRVPPPTLHDMEKGDSASIIDRRNQDWAVGDNVTIKNINPRQPNVLMVEKESDSDSYTFMNYFQLQKTGENSSLPFYEEKALLNNDGYCDNYLLWP